MRLDLIGREWVLVGVGCNGVINGIVIICEAQVFAPQRSPQLECELVLYIGPIE